MTLPGKRFADTKEQLAINMLIDHLANVPACRVYHDADQSIDTATWTPLAFNSERFDANGMHFTSSAALTGTVTKTATSAGLVGVGTAFLSELSVGQVISVPGTAAEVRVVIAISDDTHLTVNAAFANSASGQTATRVNSALVCRTAGKYMAAGGMYISGTTNTIGLHIRLNGATCVGSYYGLAVGVGDATRIQVVTPGPIALAVGDYLELLAFQSSGGAKDVSSAAQYSPEFGMWMVG